MDKRKHRRLYNIVNYPAGAYLGADLIDPDFDEIGGELTLQQVRNPLPTYLASDTPPEGGKYATKPYGYWARKQRLQGEQQGKLNIVQQLELRLDRVRKNYNEMLRRFWVMQNRFNTAIRSGVLNPKCRRCIPYNGYHTPRYWGRKQKDPW
jgi:hypothetical protein